GIAFRGAYHGQPDAGVPARCLDDRLSRFERARSLRVLDDAERETILHRAERIERFDLDIEIDVRRRDVVDLHNRRLADGLEDVGEFCHLRGAREERVTSYRLALSRMEHKIAASPGAHTVSPLCKPSM